MSKIKGQKSSPREKKWTQPVAESRYIRPTLVPCHLDIQADRSFTKIFLLSSRIVLSDGNVTRRLDDTEGVELAKTEDSPWHALQPSKKSSVKISSKDFCLLSDYVRSTSSWCLIHNSVFHSRNLLALLECHKKHLSRTSFIKKHLLQVKSSTPRERLIGPTRAPCTCPEFLQRKTSYFQRCKDTLPDETGQSGMASRSTSAFITASDVFWYNYFGSVVGRKVMISLTKCKVNARP